MQVTDTSGAQAIGTVSINIQPAPLQMTSGAVFPTGQVGVNYPPQILTSTGGTPPYTFSITGGSLPAGLTLSNGLIGGTPSVAGPFAFTLIATDSAATPLNATVGISGYDQTQLRRISVCRAATASFSLTSGTSAPPTPATVSGKFDRRLPDSFVHHILFRAVGDCWPDPRARPAASPSDPTPRRCH